MHKFASLSPVFFIYLSIHRVFSTEQNVQQPPNVAASSTTTPDVHWLFRFIPILIGYGFLFLIGRFLIRWIQRLAKGDDQILHRNCCLRFLHLFALGQPDYGLGNDGKQFRELNQIDAHLSHQESSNILEGRTRSIQRRSRFYEDVFLLFIYFVGIQGCLICMGFFQERIITIGYQRRGSNQRDFFHDAQFLVFANRMVALYLSGSYLLITWRRQPPHIQPLYLHSFASFSNVISSWCQYEALKYVSFPTQTVCKASKSVPTMLMGKFIRRQKYSAYEYFLALLLVIGASIFFLSMASSSSLTEPNKNGAISGGQPTNWLINLQENHSSTVSGLVLMCGYLFFDAFTPNWQKKLFDQPPKISTSQMMFAVNAFSVLLCLISLLHQWTFISSLQFIISHEYILVDCLLLSLGSAFGQVFIYMTIKRFGPVVLSVLMTIRQILSIILSSIYFTHPLTSKGLIGLLLVFSAIFFDIYSKYRKRRTLKR